MTKWDLLLMVFVITGHCHIDTHALRLEVRTAAAAMAKMRRRMWNTYFVTVLYGENVIGHNGIPQLQAEIHYEL